MKEFRQPVFPDDYQTIGNNVSVAFLDEPPAKEPYDSTVHLINRASRPGSLDPDWEPKDLTNDTEGYRYVPMGSTAHAEFFGPGFLATANLNGCIAVAAAYDDGRSVHGFLEHYDSESARTVDQNNRLRVSTQLAAFAGEQVVKVVVAYPKAFHDRPNPEGTADPEYKPIDVILQECGKLAAGSSVLAIPYGVSRDFADPAVGHMLYVGSGLGSTKFGWNGRLVQVGGRTAQDERGLQQARAYFAGVAEELQSEYDRLLEE